MFAGLEPSVGESVLASAHAKRILHAGSSARCCTLSAPRDGSSRPASRSTFRSPCDLSRGTRRSGGLHWKGRMALSTLKPAPCVGSVLRCPGARSEGKARVSEPAQQFQTFEDAWLPPQQETSPISTIIYSGRSGTCATLARDGAMKTVRGRALRPVTRFDGELTLQRCHIGKLSLGFRSVYVCGAAKSSPGSVRDGACVT